MKSKFAVGIIVFSLFLAMSGVASAASTSSAGRYFIPSTRSFWRNAFDARHVFDDGFTADLSDLQLRLARFTGLRPIPVKTFNILEEDLTADDQVAPTPVKAPSQSVSWSVRTMLGNDSLKKTSGGAGVTVAILDTGIDTEHPDLKGRIDGCFDLTEPVYGFVDGSCPDNNGHGTHVAGVIAADGGPDGAGLYGFAPQASISVYRVCSDAGMCFSDDIAIAMEDAVDRGANIIVLGFGGESMSSFIDAALQYAEDNDVLVIAAAGNNGPYTDSVDWPARDVRTVSVGALDNKHQPVEFSSRGLNDTTKLYVRDAGDIEVAAPGMNVESTFIGDSYAILSGTSMAAPHVAGLAALLWSSDDEHPAQVVRTKLHTHALDVGDKGDDPATGWGLPIR